MSKYVVVRNFRDAEDDMFTYRLGQTFPRDGYQPSQERIKELSTANNKLGKVLIKEVKEDKKTKSELPVDLSGNAAAVKDAITSDLDKETLKLLLKNEKVGKKRKSVIEHIESLLQEVDE